jgi:hypothetical protein
METTVAATGTEGQNGVVVQNHSVLVMLDADVVLYPI